MMVTLSSVSAPAYDASLADLPLDALRLALAPTIAEFAAFDGWSRQAVVAAAEARHVPVDLALLAFGISAPKANGAVAMIAAWIASIDAEMALALPAQQLASFPVRERIAQLVRFRLCAMEGREEAVRRALAVMALPGHGLRGARLGWRSADLMWRLAGDMATDYNHYTKRTMLAALYAATLMAFVHDKSDDKKETLAFLDRRIEGVMRFEKAKARLLGRSFGSAAGKHTGQEMRRGFSVTRFLGRLRYPA